MLDGIFCPAKYNIYNAKVLNDHKKKKHEKIAHKNLKR